MPSIVCPECRATVNRVVDTRLSTRTTEIRRRRQCPNGHRFTTVEHVEAGHPLAAPEVSEAQMSGLIIQFRDALNGVLRGAWERAKVTKVPGRK